VSEGVHLTNSSLKGVDDITPFTPDFFWVLANLPVTRVPFKEWYFDNFMHLSELRGLLIDRVSQVLPHEHRVQDVWAQVLPAVSVNSMLNCTQRLGAVLDRVSKAEVRPSFGVKKAPVKQYEPIPVMHMQGRSITPQCVRRSANASFTPFPSMLSQNEQSVDLNSSERAVSKASGLRTSSIPVARRRPSEKLTFENHSHLLKQAKGPKKLVYSDPIEYLNALNKLRFDYSKATQSSFIKNYWRVQPEYKSRRDELGGTITEHQWTAYIDKLERVLKAHKQRRRNRRQRRKLRPVRSRPDPLYQAVFIEQVQTPLEVTRASQGRKSSPARRTRIFEL
jgi:hypothetical protein